MRSLQIAALIIAFVLYFNNDAMAQIKAKNVKHVKVYYEKGMYGGWPANNGIWIWGDEILVGFAKGYYKDLGPEFHNMDREKPEKHLMARSINGGAFMVD